MAWATNEHCQNQALCRPIFFSVQEIRIYGNNYGKLHKNTDNTKKKPPKLSWDEEVVERQLGINSSSWAH